MHQRPSIVAQTLRAGFLVLLSACLVPIHADARPVSRVVIDPGHGGKDKGTHRGSVYEKNLALQVGLKVEALLKAKGMPVTMTRRTDTFLSLEKRAAIANRYKDAVFVSIHFNGHSNYRYHGVETYYYGAQGQKLAAHIHLRLLSRLKIKNRDTRQRKDLAVLRLTRCPAVLVECAYLSNPYERKRAQKGSYQDACAQAIVDGIFAYKTYR
ncbi:N-acetylmuramoyl-L-alanine amidase [Verrucomicrobiaceae bacterium N1E253]|uniref:N-acetylmuramoyl-L-alanine amidase n=1 Tax=Oceaniferula marina TaxID=2748318 RepID=A0A851GKE5_9BACT|nr:N-acetylmuramoyl-L-alanine amidase [Oceaniferula marina]NWK56321.1 N-acetylmuramoyl-L-alanine amidase [Oceaniferula marina]